LEDSEARVHPQGDVPRELVRRGVLAEDPKEETSHGGARNGQVQHENVTQRERQAAALPTGFVQDADSADDCVRVQYDGCQAAREQLCAQRIVLVCL